MQAITAGEVAVAGYIGVKKVALASELLAGRRWHLQRDGALVLHAADGTLLAFDQVRIAVPARELGPAISIPNAKARKIRDVSKWMECYARAAIAARHGAKPKRDDAIRECMTTTRATYREALSAWQHLPKDLKRTPRETDRATAGK